MEIESTKSNIISLAAVHEHRAELNAKRKSMLEKVPEIGDYKEFPKGYIEADDLAYLTAYTDCEFAWLSGKKQDILFHGEKYRCSFDKELSDDLEARKYELYMHSHPDEDEPVPSIADRDVLVRINQTSSKIISSTTRRVIDFTSNQCLDYLL